MYIHIPWKWRGGAPSSPKVTPMGLSFMQAYCNYEGFNAMNYTILLQHVNSNFKNPFVFTRIYINP